MLLMVSLQTKHTHIFKLIQNFLKPFLYCFSAEIMWPESDDELIFMPDDAKYLIMGLLTHDPLARLGAGGAIEIKQHPFFINLDWDNLLRIKADFIPQLDGPDDTSYFDTRSERYNHDADSNDDDPEVSSSKQSKQQQQLSDSDEYLSSGAKLSKLKKTNSVRVTGSKKEKLSQEDLLKSSNNMQQEVSLEEDTDNELFASFSSCSSKFKNSQHLLNNSINSNLNQLASEIQPQSNTNSTVTPAQTPPSPSIVLEKSIIQSDEPVEGLSTSSSASLIVNAPSSDNEKRASDTQDVCKETQASAKPKSTKLTTHASLSTNSKLRLKQLLTESLENNNNNDGEKAMNRKAGDNSEKLKITSDNQKGAADSPTTTSLPHSLIKNVTTRAKFNNNNNKEGDSSSNNLNRHSAIYSSASNLSQSAPQQQQLQQQQQQQTSANNNINNNNQLQRPSKLSRHNLTSASFNCKRKFYFNLKF